MSKSGIMVIGGINIDLVMRVPRVPQIGETVKGRDFGETPGGKGANQAVACGRLGGEVSMLGKVGKDAFASLMIENLRKSGVNTGLVEQADSFTGVALIMVGDDASNIISCAPGANGMLLEADIDKYESELADSSILLVQNECRIETVTYAIKKAAEVGTTVLYNPAPALEIDDEVISCCDVIIPNETEAEFLTGIKVESDESMQQAADYFLQRGCGTVIITLGERGAFYKDGQSSGLIPAPKVDAVDTVAAGDVFLGAFAVSYGKGGALEDSIKLATHAAAISVTEAGAQASIPEIEAVYEKYPNLRSEQ